MPPQTMMRISQSVSDIYRHSEPYGRLAGFAIDSPVQGESCPGEGIEINGWVIGRDEPIVRLIASVDTDSEITADVDVHRPDVHNEYPAFLWASKCGFSFWVPLPHREKNDFWAVELKAVFADGCEVLMARISGRQVRTRFALTPGSRFVSAPDYIILGTQRGGTTSLFRYLGAHPDVRHPATKELHYLTDRYHRGPSWYLGQFPETLRPGEVTGEATPYALFHPRAPGRAKDVAPDARFIVLLRDPVERAISHYHHERALGVESLPFTEAIEAEDIRLAGEEFRLQNDPTYIGFNHKHFSYLARGNYAEQLVRWLNYFPRNQFLILQSEELYSEPESTMRKVLDFLGLRRIELGPFEAHNQSVDRNSEVPDLTKLRRYFAPINQELDEISAWFEPRP